MVELYGTAFLSAYGERPSPLWTAAIAELSDDECRRGFITLAKQAREYPANLTQFVAACRPVSGSPHMLGPAITAEDWARLIPPPEQRAAPEKIDSFIAKMRRSVGA